MAADLESKAELHSDDFWRLMKDNNFSIGYPAYYSTTPNSCASDLSGVVSYPKHQLFRENCSGDTQSDNSLAVFSTRGQGGPVFDIVLVRGPSIDPCYIQSLLKLRNLLESKEIKYRSNIDFNILKQEATNYARSLLDAANAL